MTVFADRPAPASTFLDDLTPDSGLALRRWTSDEFRRLFSSEVLSEMHLDLTDGEIVERDTHAPYLFNRGEYYNLTDFGILGPEERTELIYGRIIKRMSAMTRPHSIAISKTADALETAFGGGYFTEQQMPLHVARGSEPEPDVMVLAGIPDNYAGVPRPADVLLLVEVSNSTLSYDRNTKSRLYAESNIADYWIVNLQNRTLEVRRQPEGGQYASLRVYREADAVAPLAAPSSPVRVSDLLPMVQE